MRDTRIKVKIRRIDPKPLTNADVHIARLKGIRFISKPPSFQNIETGELYCHLAGSAFPPGKYPGYGLVLGILKGEQTDSEPAFRVLEEFETPNLEDLLKLCIEKAGLWGARLSETLFRPWCGNFDAYASIIDGVNTWSQKQGAEGYYLSFSTSPMYHNESERFSVYLNSIRPLVEPKNKRLYLQEANTLRTQLQNLLPGAVETQRLEEYPAVAALGDLICDLLESKSWAMNVEQEIPEDEFEEPEIDDLDLESSKFD